ncbi:MAG: RHS repeat-associated core domain-containing protein [Vicinamibacteria bacterium]|nr:RHS repeat-associated core domain-containing protein [Vicinamibacteria bacterium]
MTLGLIGFVVGVLSAATAEASISRDLPRSALSIKAAEDPFATAPQLALPSLTQELKVIDDRLTAASGCVALCDLADAIEVRAFVRVALVPRNRAEGYTGHYWDKESSLYYAKARYYDPFTARFTQADSFLGNIDDPPSLHRYFYVHANPTRYTDSTGHFLDSAGQYLREVPKVAPLVVAVGEGVSAIGAATFAAAAAGITLIAGGGYLVVATVGAWEDAERAKLYDETQKTLVELGRIRADARRGIVITEDEDAGDRLQDLKRRDEARAQGAELGDIKPKKERRPKFRKATRDHAWEEAAPGPIDDTKSCPDCGKMLTGKKDPETGKVDFQLDHFEKSWAERSDELNKAKASRAERNDAYQEKVRVSCAPCNESKGGQFGAQRKAEKRDKVVVRPQAPQPTPMPREP